MHTGFVRLAPLGLVLMASVMLFFAWAPIGGTPGLQRTFLTLEGGGLLLAALAFRDIDDVPGEGLAMVGLTLFATTEAVHFVTSVAAGFTLGSMAFLVYVLGAVVMAGGAFGSWRALMVTRQHANVLRVGAALAGASYVAFIFLNVASAGGFAPFAFVPAAGAVGAALFVAAFRAPRDEAMGSPGATAVPVIENQSS